MGVGGGRAPLGWPATAASPKITMEIHISDRTHKFQSKTRLDAKANSELYKSKRVCSVPLKLCWPMLCCIAYVIQLHELIVTLTNALVVTQEYNLQTAVIIYLKVFTNEKRGGLRVTSFDRPPFQLLSRKFSKESVQAPSCERHKTTQRTMFLLFVYYRDILALHTADEPLNLSRTKFGTKRRR
jgi:hypothetical protein